MMNRYQLKRLSTHKRCGFEWPDRENPEHPHRCERLGQHRGDHRCLCGSSNKQEYDQRKRKRCSVQI